MVTAAIWDAVTSFVAWLLGLFPTISMPSWVDSIATYAAQGIDTANGFHNWLPLSALRNGLVFVLACSAMVLTVRGFRIVLSLFTGGGGGAA